MRNIRVYQSKKMISDSFNGIHDCKKRVVIDGTIFIRDNKGNYVVDNSEKPSKINSPEDARPWISHMKNYEQEVFAVLLLDGSHNVISLFEITKGLVNQSQIHPREAFKEAVRHSAVSIIMVHNHPSGSQEPSQADLLATRKMVEAGKTLGIPVLDHLLVAGERIVSLRERNPELF
jgi:DNA repair protein RadC